MQRTYTIRNDVNLKRDSLRFIRDEQNPSLCFLAFSFDSSADCSISIYYAAKEINDGGSPRFQALKGDSPPKMYFEKGLGQSYKSSVPLNTELYSADELKKYEPSAGIYPLVVQLETVPGRGEKCAVESQTTYGKISITDDSDNQQYCVQSLKQKIQVGKLSYELQEIYGIEGQRASTDAEGEPEETVETNGRDCVICMTAPRDTTVLPCRHMCMCSDCAKLLRHQSNKCPICRTPIESLLQIKISATPNTTSACKPSAASAADTMIQTQSGPSSAQMK